MELQIVGIIMVGFCGVCGTVLLVKLLDGIARVRIERLRIEQADRARHEEQSEKAVCDKWIQLYYSERNEKDELKVQNRILSDELNRCKSVMAMTKLADVGGATGKVVD